MNKIKALLSFLYVQFFAHTIELAQTYTAVLDEIYEIESMTMELEAPSWLKMAGSTAKTIQIPKVTTTGLKNYSRTTGYQSGDNTLEFEEHTYAIDRGIEFEVDRADNMEVLGRLFGFWSQQFMRTQVTPEIDAYRISTIAGRATGAGVVSANLDATTALQAWDAALVYMTNAKVRKSNLMCYMSADMRRLVKQSNLLTREQRVAPGFSNITREFDMLDNVMIKELPQDRLYTAITLQDGSNSGYIKNATTGRDINFMLFDPMAALADKKIDALKIFDPDTNQKSDGWLFQYRCYHDIFTPDNKVPGIYVHHKTT